MKGYPDLWLLTDTFNWDIHNCSPIIETCICQTIVSIAFQLQMELINVSRGNLVHRVYLDLQGNMDFPERWERKVILFQVRVQFLPIALYAVTWICQGVDQLDVIQGNGT